MDNKNSWLPTSVEKIKNSFKFECSDVLKKNLAYNIQYLQFLLKNIEEEETTTVLYRMRYKTFIVTCMSIIEAVFIALLDERNLIPIISWKDGEHKYRSIDDNTDEVYFKRKKADPRKKIISLDEATNLIEKNNILKDKNDYSSAIRLLRDLRNHLHLNKAQELSNSDYNNFTEASYYLSKLVFLNIMMDDSISVDKEYLEFINI